MNYYMNYNMLAVSLVLYELWVAQPPITHIAPNKTRVFKGFMICVGRSPTQIMKPLII